MGRRVVVWALVAVVLLAASCGNSGGRIVVIRPAAITSDNSGGAIAFYQTWRMSDDHSLVEFYTQRISPEGDFIWGEKGILVGSGYADFCWTCDLYAVNDGSGGAFVMWREPLTEPPYHSQPYVAKIDSGGNLEWQRGIPGVEQAIPDGSGGVIIAYSASVLKVDAEGNLPWGEDGVSLDLGLFDVASYNSGGIIVVSYAVGNISAHRVDSGGNILWQTGGVEVCGIRGGAARVVNDGSGGAIIAYEQYIPCGGGSQANCDIDIYAQRIDAEGNVLWGPDGVPVCVEPTWSYDPAIIDDGAGGAIVFFVSIENNSPAIHALRIDADGHKLWPEDVQVWEGTYVSAISDGSGGAVSVYYAGEGTNATAQRLDAAGRKLWGADGTTLTLRDFYGLGGVVSDSCGGVLISWSAVKFKGDEVSQVSYYVQRVDGEGNVV